MPSSKHYLWLILIIGLFLAQAVRAEVSPARMLLLRGTVALSEGRAAQAAGDLQEAAEMYPEDWRCQLLFGQALLKAGDFARARAQFRRATLLSPVNPEPWQALARAARDMKDSHLEIAAISGLLRLLPDDPQQLRRLAKLYRATGRKADADKLDAKWRETMPPLKLDYIYRVGYHLANLDELRKLAQDEPGNKAILYAQSSEEVRAGNMAEARECLRKLYVSSPQNPEITSAYAHICLITDQMEQGLQVLRQATPKGNLTQDRALALWSMSIGRYSDAIEPLSRTLMLNVIDATQNRLLGLAQLMSGNPQAACAGYRIAWLREHDHLSAQQYAMALQADGQPEEAEDILKRAIERSPQETALTLQLSLLYRDTKREQQCAQLTEQLSRTRPENVELLIMAGERYLRAGYIQRAYTIASTLRDAYPKDKVALLGAVSLFHRLAVRDEARLTLTRYLGPSFPTPMPPAELLLQVAQFAMADNHLPDAAMALTEALKKDPACREAYRQLGKLYLQQSSWNEAISTYNQALEQWPGDAEFTLALARVTWQAGNYPLAMALYRRTATLMPLADPLLELGTLYYRQGDESRAQECWLAAMQRPGGGVRARLSLLVSYEHANEPDRVKVVEAELLELLTSERATRAARWKTELTAAGLPPTAEEIDALLLLEPDLIDPAALQHRVAPPEAPAPVVEEPETAPAPAPAVEEPETAPAPAPVISDK